MSMIVQHFFDVVSTYKQRQGDLNVLLLLYWMSI